MDNEEKKKKKKDEPVIMPKKMTPAMMSKRFAHGKTSVPKPRKPK